MSTFQFKQFQVSQSQAAFKIGTDSVLLGAWAQPIAANRILDIGTGTGLLALMCAQKNPSASIEAIEIDPASFQEAQFNFQQSPWANRLRALNEDVNGFSTENQERYDYIICNPPYFSNGTLNPSAAEAQARHGLSLNLEKLAAYSSNMLIQNGKLALVLPEESFEQFTKSAEENNLHCFRKLIAYKKEGSSQALILSEWAFDKREPITSEINIRNSQGNYSEEHIKLTEAFYLDRP